MQNYTLAFLGTFLFPILLMSCSSFREPDFKGIENVKTTAISLSHTSLAIDLHYFNPNNTQIKLKNAEGDAWIDGTPLGRFFMDTLILIPAKADFRLPVKLELEMKSVLKNSLAVFLKNEVMLKIEGQARIGKAGFYINYPVRYEGKQNISGLLK